MVKERTASCLLLAVNQLPLHTEVKFIKDKHWFGLLKALTDHFEGGSRVYESILIRSLLVNWRLGYFFNLILKGLLHKISKKPLDAA